MNFLNNPSSKSNAQRLRRDMTKEERRLWYDFFKTVGIHANRQKPIGPYIVDFYLASHKLVIELDGGQHYEQAGLEHDEKRDRFLREQGLTVLRYSNADVNRNFRGVCEDIMRHMGMIFWGCRYRLPDAAPPHPSSGFREAPDATFPSRGRLASNERHADLAGCLPFRDTTSSVIGLP